MKAYVRAGDTLPLIAPRAVSAGGFVRRNHLIGVALESGVTGQTLTCAMVGVFRLPKATNATFAAGAPVYVVPNATGNVRTTATGNHILGFAVAAATAGPDTVEVALKGYSLSQVAGQP